MILLLDNFDSFTYNLVHYFGQLGVDCAVFRNNESLDVITAQEYDAVVLSPGPESPQKAGNLMEVLRYYQNKLPILGICLGHQAIGELFGAELVKAQRPMHGKVSEIAHIEDDLFKGIPDRFKVVRYHSLILKKLPPCIKATSTTDLGEVMSITHTSLPICGLQFHPEAIMTEFGLNLLSNWIISWNSNKNMIQ